MKNFFPLVVACALAAATFMPTAASAQVTDAHTVTVTIQAINVLDVGNGVTLIVNGAAAGSQPTTVQGTTDWSLTTNSVSAMKVTAYTDAPMPAGLTLRSNLTAPAVGASQGFVALGTTPTDMVRNISQVAGQNLTMTYEASATVAALTGSPSFLVTYTLTTQ